MDDYARFGYLALLLVAVGGVLITELRTRPGKTVRLAAVWGMIFLGVIAVIGLWDDISQRIAPQARMMDDGRIEVPVSDDGHFNLTAQINGQPIRFVVDTGASTIALGPDDARKAGIDPDNLGYVGQAQTANGIVDTASVLLDSVQIGDIQDQNVDAVVLRSDLGLSLMGMSYLSRFARVTFEGDRLILER